MADTSVDGIVVGVAVVVLLLIGLGFGVEVGLFFALGVPMAAVAWLWTD